MGKYFYRNGQFLKITGINGSYSIKYKSYIGRDEANFIFFGVSEFMQEVRQVNAYGQMMLSFQGL
jgi:hypothetical protein